MTGTPERSAVAPSLAGTGRAVRRNAAAGLAVCLLVLTVVLAIASPADGVPGQAWLVRNSEAWVLAALFLLDRQVVSGTASEVRSWVWTGFLLACAVVSVAVQPAVPGAFATQRESFAAAVVLAVHFRLTAPWRAHRRGVLAVLTATIVAAMGALLAVVAWNPAAVGTGVADLVSEYAETLLFVPLAIVMYDLVYGWTGSAAPPVVRLAWLAGLLGVPLWTIAVTGGAPTGPAEFWARTTEALLAVLILSVWFELSKPLASARSVGD